jgi:monofunctional biosynthetic peptidoglycan transglycosylase
MTVTALGAVKAFAGRKIFGCSRTLRGSEANTEQDTGDGQSDAHRVVRQYIIGKADPRIAYAGGVGPRKKTTAVRVKRPSRPGGWLRRLLWLAVGLVLGFYLLVALALAGLRWINPPFTAVQVQRRIEAHWHKTPYHKRFTFVPLDRISRDFQHAVIAAEDARFYEHHGFDWNQVQIAFDESLEGGRTRGASTITQQLVKNLFLTTSRSAVRKGIEFTLVPMAEQILGKQRILELYLNVIEWGPEVYGAEAAAQYHYGTSAARVNREQGARLAAILPAPLRRKPARMRDYSARILERMRQMSW